MLLEAQSFLPPSRLDLLLRTVPQGAPQSKPAETTKYSTACRKACKLWNLTPYDMEVYPLREPLRHTPAGRKATRIEPRTVKWGRVSQASITLMVVYHPPYEVRSGSLVDNPPAQPLHRLATQLVAHRLVSPCT